MNGSQYIIVGSTEEAQVRIFSSSTGKMLRTVLFDVHRDQSSPLVPCILYAKENG